MAMTYPMVLFFTCLAALILLSMSNLGFFGSGTSQTDEKRAEDRLNGRLDTMFLAIRRQGAQLEELLQRPASAGGGGGGGKEQPGAAIQPQKGKEDCEMSFWNMTYQKEVAKRVIKEGQGMQNGYYTRLYTQGLELETSFYKDKKVLDVGCGPRGSLEWLKGIARTTVCADPLADKYTAFGTTSHSMLYVTAGVEEMPIASHSVDIIASINNFDHIVNAEQGLREILRILQPTGHFVIIVELHPIPTRCEPLALGWDFHEFVERAGFKIVKSRYHMIPEGKQHTFIDQIFGTRLTPEKVRELAETSSKQAGWFVGVFTPK